MKKELLGYKFSCLPHSFFSSTIGTCLIMCCKDVLSHLHNEVHFLCAVNCLIHFIVISSHLFAKSCTSNLLVDLDSQTIRFFCIFYKLLYDAVELR